MSSSTTQLTNAGAPASAPLVVVELDRRSGLKQHPDLGVVELVDHVLAWVFEDGMVLAAVVQHSVLAGGLLLGQRTMTPPDRPTTARLQRPRRGRRR